MTKTYVVTPNYTIRPPPTLISGDEPEQNAQETNVVSEGTDTKAPPKPTSAPGTLFLGDIIRNPLAAELRVINRKDRLSIPQDLLILPVDVKKNFKATRGSLLKGRFGIWASLLAGLGLPAGADVSVGFERSSDDIISAEELETQEIEVDDDFVKKSMKLKSVEAYLEGCRNEPPPLFIVTGLKIVRGAGAKSEATAKLEASIAANALAGNSAKLLEFVKSRSSSQEFEWSTPFVLAFQVRKILYKRGRWEHKLSTKGASMMDGDQVLESKKIEVEGPSQVDGPDKESLEEMISRGDALVVESDEDAVHWIIPNTE